MLHRVPRAARRRSTSITATTAVLAIVFALGAVRPDAAVAATSPGPAGVAASLGAGAGAAVSEETETQASPPVVRSRARPGRSLGSRTRRAVSRAWGRLPYELQLSRLRSRSSWAIGLYGGTDVTDLAPLQHTRNPILTRYDVRDADAAFVADPFLFRWADRWYLFFEYFNWDTGLGEIGVASNVDSRRWRYEGTALVEPHHLSYPLAFEVDGIPHLMVESSTANVVRAYRAVDFPRRWEPVGDLLADGPRVDPTMFAHDGRWWLFTGGRDDTHRWGRLDLHMASHPLGPYSPHPANPVAYNEPRLARPAGRVVDAGGRLLRFGQDCADDYGVRVYAAEIETLTPEAYAEKPLLDRPIVEPRGRGWNRAHMHHFDAHRMPDGSWIAAVDGW